MGEEEGREGASRTVVCMLNEKKNLLNKNVKNVLGDIKFSK